MCASLGAAAVAWYRTNAARMSVFFDRISAPKEGYEMRWLADRLRAFGAVCKYGGANTNRFVTISFLDVDKLSLGYVERITTSYDKRKNEAWRGEWTSFFGVDGITL
jgi:hypothetical protein